MPFSMTLPSKDELLKATHSMKARLANLKEKGEATAGKVIHGAEIVATPFALGYLAGAKGAVDTAAGNTEPTYEVAGYDVRLGVGVVGVGLGLTEMLGKHSDHALFVGLGALADWAGSEGRAKGVASKTT